MDCKSNQKEKLTENGNHDDRKGYFITNKSTTVLNKNWDIGGKDRFVSQDYVLLTYLWY